MNRALMDRVSWNSKTSILVYFKHDIITKLLKTKNVSVGTDFYRNENLRSKKWLLCFNYNPNKFLLEHHLNEIQVQREFFVKKIPQISIYHSAMSVVNFKYQISTVVLENYQKSIVNHYREKSILLNFVNLSAIFCPWFTEKHHLISDSARLHGI